MTSTTDLIITISIFLLIIIVPILLIRRQARSKAKKKLGLFTSYCQTSGLQIEYLMQRKDRMAALDSNNRKIAWMDFNQEELKNPIILSIEPTKKQILKTTKDGRITQKITIHPTFKTPSKEVSDIVFYDWAQDDTSQLESYLEEAQEWENAIQSI